MENLKLYMVVKILFISSSEVLKVKKLKGDAICLIEPMESLSFACFPTSRKNIPNFYALKSLFISHILCIMHDGAVINIISQYGPPQLLILHSQGEYSILGNCWE